MNSNHFVRLTKISLLCAAAALSGCSWLQSIEIDPTRDWTANQLYTEARSAMNEGTWEVARDYYPKLEARYPFGSYAQQAQIDLAYVNFKDDDAAGAVQQLDRFLRAYPNHPNSDYALYLKALATLNERDGWLSAITTQDLADRDAQAARDAFDIFKELAARFPDSRYAPEARRRMHELVNAQAEHQLATARFYYDRKAYVAAVNRAKVVISDFQTTAFRDDALVLIADCYNKLGMYDLEKDTRRIIELNKIKPKETEESSWFPSLLK